MAKSNKPKELTTEIIQDEKAMDELTNELITNLTEESKVESDAVETILEQVPLTSEDSFTAPVIPALPISVLRDLAKSRPLESKINRLLDEVEQAFTH